MKLIKYEVKTADRYGKIIGGWSVKRLYSEANEEIAKREAYNGEYTIEDEFEPIEKNPETPETENSSIWDALETAYQEGVDSI